MSTFQTGTACLQKLDPLKRLNYTYGMVLGVNEFQQEQTYLVAKDHSQYRLAHGYGTISGLRVQVVTAPNLEVKVSRGVAINPRGQEIHVTQEMCALLNDWLTANQTALQSLLGTAPLNLSLCLVLAYRECPTDSVPVPGEPCRTQQDAMAAVHIAESFQLRLCIDAAQSASPDLGSLTAGAAANGLCFRPAQIEEEAIRAFGDLLDRIQIVESGPSSITKEELKAAVRELGSVPVIDIGSPDVHSPILINRGEAREFLRAALGVWITEVRPDLYEEAIASGHEPEQSVLLAELHFAVTKNWQVSGTVTVDESHRPFLLQSRLLQEFLTSGAAGGGEARIGPAVVAAGTFRIVAGQALPLGPTFNGLTAMAQGAAGTFLLDWSGVPAYVGLTSSPPDLTSYVVQGTAMAGLAKSGPYVFQVLGFQNNGILIGVQGATGADPAAGFSVQISEIVEA